MTRRIGLRLIATLALTIAIAGTAFAHEGHEHKVMGTVTMAAPDHVMVKDKAGKEVTIAITKDTKVLRDNKDAKVEDIQTGMRIVVTAVTEKGKTAATARKIELGPAKGGTN